MPATRTASDHSTPPTVCEDCHTTSAWEPVFTVDHFQVLGTCTSCHDDGDQDSRSPADHRRVRRLPHHQRLAARLLRPPGRQRRLRQLPCQHQDKGERPLNTTDGLRGLSHHQRLGTGLHRRPLPGARHLHQLPRRRRPGQSITCRPPPSATIATPPTPGCPPPSTTRA